MYQVRLFTENLKSKFYLLLWKELVPHLVRYLFFFPFFFCSFYLSISTGIQFYTNRTSSARGTDVQFYRNRHLFPPEVVGEIVPVTMRLLLNICY